MLHRQCVENGRAAIDFFTHLQVTNWQMLAKKGAKRNVLVSLEITDRWEARVER